MERMYPSVNLVNVQRRVTIFGVKTQESPDDPVQGVRHSYFHALTSSITFVSRLMLNACLLSLLECLSISTSLPKLLCYTCYQLNALAYLDHLVD